MAISIGVILFGLILAVLTVCGISSLYLHATGGGAYFAWVIANYERTELMIRAGGLGVVMIIGTILFYKSISKEV